MDGEAAADAADPGGESLFGDHFRRVLQKVEGCVAVALVGADGIPVSRMGSADAPDLELTAAVLADATSRLRRASEEVDTGALEEVLVSMGRHAFVIHAVTEDYLLLAVLERGGSLGRARFELRRAARLLHDELA